MKYLAIIPIYIMLGIGCLFNKIRGKKCENIFN